MVQAKSPASSDPVELSAQPGDLIRLAPDGETYELARAGALSLRQRSRVAFLAERLNFLEGKKDPTTADEKEFTKRLRELAAIAIPDAPKRVLAKLDEERLGDLAHLFFVRSAVRSRRLGHLRNAAKEMGVGTALEAMLAAQSLGSSASTEETRSAGST